MKKLTLALLLSAMASQLAAQLSPAQREQDFRSLAMVFAKRYAPANWKIAALNVNLFQISPWLDRVRAAKSDIEFLEICAQYVSSLQDGHTQFVGPGNFVADLGFYVDLYDNQLLIDLVDRSLLPVSRYPFQIGDELVSIDGRPAREVAEEFAKLHTYANARYSLRIAALSLTYRRQADIPSAGLLGETAQVSIRRQSGEVETYSIRWAKEGTPITKFGVTPDFFSRETVGRRSESSLDPAEEGSTEIPLWQKVHDRFKQWRIYAGNDPLRRSGRVNAETGETEAQGFFLGYGSNRPVWAPPAGFAQRQGRNQSDYFYSGTYMSEGKRIGYLRIGAFNSLSQSQTQILDNEINYFNNNTDGLVVDVMRNPGGTCSLATIGQRLVPGSFTHFSEQLRPSFDLINSYDEIISLLEILGAPAYLLENYRFERKMLLDAYQNGRGLTGPVPACSFELNFNGTANAYRKPMIVLVDDFSTSAADIFAAMVQDNGRAKLVGVKTSGAGGAVEFVSAGAASESATTNTISLVMRAKEYEYPGFPKSPYIENVGVRPDIELDYMTKANLLGRGSPFVEAFTKLIVEEIQKVSPQ